MKHLIKKRTINQLLVIHLALSTPWALLALIFHGVFALIAYVWITLGWAVLRHLNRLAWKRHFQPKQTHPQA